MNDYTSSPGNIAMLNWNCNDPTHIVEAKYYTQQVVLKETEDGKSYTWDKFVTFRCKQIQSRRKEYKTYSGDMQGKSANNIFIETRWLGINYNVNDYVEYRGVKYIIISVDKDEFRVNAQVLLTFKTNPNTYYTLELKQVDITDMKGGVTNVG